MPTSKLQFIKKSLFFIFISVGLIRPFLFLGGLKSFDRTLERFNIAPSAFVFSDAYFFTNAVLSVTFTNLDVVSFDTNKNLTGLDFRSMTTGRSLYLLLTRPHLIPDPFRGQLGKYFFCDLNSLVDRIGNKPIKNVKLEFPLSATDVQPKVFEWSCSE